MEGDALCTGASYVWGNVTLFCIVSSSCWRMKYALMGQVTLGARFPGPMQYGASWVPPTPAGMCYSSPHSSPAGTKVLLGARLVQVSPPVKSPSPRPMVQYGLPCALTLHLRACCWQGLATRSTTPQSMTPLSMPMPPESEY